MKDERKPASPATPHAPEDEAGPIRRTDIEHADQLGSEGVDPDAQTNRTHESEGPGATGE